MAVKVLKRRAQAEVNRTGPRTRWVRRRHFIDAAGDIRPVRGAAIETYNPTACQAGEADPLHVELAALDLQDTRAVEDFASTWGLLGTDQNRQPMVEFQEAAQEFRKAFEVASSTSDGHMDEEAATWLQSVFEGQFDGLQPVAQLTTERRVDRPQSQGDNVTGWSLHWKLPSLLSAAHLLLFQDLAAGRRPRLCANVKCGRPFVTDRSDKVYCSARCSDQHKQREIRRREAERALREVEEAVNDVVAAVKRPK